ncbi:glycosyltransferase [Vibrio sp. D404a]|uniref:glycosyltransferase family 2 protein n=1 Tax=unclassified Vibrio TaxID=2614977 RepID=UPI0025526C3D|nr:MULTISPECIES: glycosyltransferase [unclassified Vibrio]MDK9737728.1 glycosyltransferase [Vibrio sp. D404a]MDK9795330.1 glycosyltransferase [Vibrio sp. D449a]
MLDITSQKLESQEDIMSFWDNKDEVCVSIICATYNQENYIQDAIVGFLMQKTNFRFEIVIHDDASTDNTANIVKSYQKRYPDIIKPIFQKENQYSKGGFKPLRYASRFARSKYLALCEGDDFWVNKNKLQVQYDELESNPQVKMCFHPAYELYPNGSIVKSAVYANKKRTFSTEEVIKIGGGFSPTASVFVRKDVFGQLNELFQALVVGDYYNQILSSIPNGVIYLPVPMSVYRRLALNSFTNENTKDVETSLNFHRKVLDSNNNFNQVALGGKYEKEFRMYESYLLFGLLIKKDHFYPFFKEFYKTIFTKQFFMVSFKLLKIKIVKKISKKKYSYSVGD